MRQEEPECHDGSQKKWALGDGSAEGGVLRETGSSPVPHWELLLLLPLHSFITGPRTLCSGPCPARLLEAGPGKCLCLPPAFQQSPALGWEWRR